MGTEVEVLPPTDQHEPSTAALAVRHDPEGSLVRPAAPLEEIAEAFHAYQAMCARLLVDEDHQQIGRRSFRKKSAWRKLAVAFGVSTELVSKDYERDERGRIVRAEVVTRAVAPNGRYMDGLGACDVTERCCDAEVCTNTQDWHTHCEPDCRGFVHFSKPSHDIPATAMTRATNRACSDLFGFGEVSAEEVDTGAAETPPPARQSGARRASRARAQSKKEPAKEPEGFASRDEGEAAHKAISARIRALPDDIDRAPFVRYREQHGWPMSRALLDGLTALVDRAEGSLSPEEDPGRPFEAPASTERPPDAPGGGSVPEGRLERPCQGCGVAEATTAIEDVELCESCEQAELDYRDERRAEDASSSSVWD